jgi:hypothetical protein
MVVIGTAMMSGILMATPHIPNEFHVDVSVGQHHGAYWRHAAHPILCTSLQTKLHGICDGRH